MELEKIIRQRLRRGYDDRIIKAVAEHVDMEGEDFKIDFEKLSKTQDEWYLNGRYEDVRRVWSVMEQIGAMACIPVGYYGLTKDCINVCPREYIEPVYFNTKKDAEAYRKHFFSERHINHVLIVHYLS